MFRAVEAAQAVGQDHVDAAGEGIDFCADVRGQWNQQFTLRSIYFENRRSNRFFARKLDIANGTEQSRRLRKRAWRRCYDRGVRECLEYAATDEVRNKILSCRKSHALRKGEKDFKSAKFFRI